MAISAELQREIEMEIAGVTDFRRPRKSINWFISDYGSNLAQAEKDLQKLHAAGLNSSLMPRYRAYLEMFTISRGVRLGASTESPDKRADFDRKMALAEMDRRRFVVVAGHIAENCGDKRTVRNYRHLSKGSGITDTLSDNLGYIGIIRSFPKLASQIRPGGMAIDEAYMLEAERRAVELLVVKGYVVKKGIPENAGVDRQNRLLTLCLQAQSEIKKFAYAAFFDQPDYYNKYYASQSPDSDAADLENPVTEVTLPDA